MYWRLVTVISGRRDGATIGVVRGGRGRGVVDGHFRLCYQSRLDFNAS